METFRPLCRLVVAATVREAKWNDEKGNIFGFAKQSTSTNDDLVTNPK